MTEQAERQPFWEAQGLPAPGTRMTAPDYFALPETNTRMELIDGVVVYPHWDEETMSPAPTPTHQDIVLRVGAWLLSYARERGGSAHVAPVDVMLPDDAVVQPDVMWRSADSACARTEKRFRGAPELVVEVLSPSTAGFDRGGKYALYERSGVREYWIVDPVHRTLEVWTASEGSMFVRQGAYGAAETLTSPTLSADVDTSIFFDANS